MVRLTTVFIIGLLLSSSLLAQDREVIDKVVGVVGNELVLLSDLEEQYNYMVSQQGSVPDGFRCNILDNLLANSLLLCQAKLDSIPITDEEVETQLDARFDHILQLMNGDEKQFYEYYGQTPAEMKEKMREDLKNQMLVERMRESVVSTIDITPSEVRDFFNKVPVDSLPYFNSEVELAEVVYKPKVNDEQGRLAREKLTEIRTRILEEGEDFGDLATLYSDDPGSGRVGGDLGWAKRGSYVPEFEAAAYNLKVNEISPLIETEFGFHIIQQLERRGNSLLLRHILVKPEITDGDLELAQSKLMEIRELILTDSISFSQAVKRFSDQNQQSFTNDGNLVNNATGNTFFEIGDLDPEVYFTIDTMEVGDISQPFPFRTGPGETSYRIVLLKSRTKPHKASLELDYTKIKMAAIEQKKSLHLNEWVQERVQNTYIQVDPSYNYCPTIKLWTNQIRP